MADTELRRTGRDIILNRLIASVLVPHPLRWRLMRALGMDVQESWINPGVFVESLDLAIGKDAFVNAGVWFDCSNARITIGEGVAIGQSVLLTTSGHDVSDPELRAGPTLGLPITVGRGAWLGARAIICPGVTVGAGCIVGAGSVVTKDCAPHGLYVGAPARRVKDLSTEPVGTATAEHG